MSSIDKALGAIPAAAAIQARRLEIVAGNIANVSTPKYKARDLDFRQVMATLAQDGAASATPAARTAELQRANPQVFDPDNPNADDNGYVYRSNVNPLEEMTDMLEAARSYESALSTASTARELMMRTLDLNTK